MIHLGENHDENLDLKTMIPLVSLKSILGPGHVFFRISVALFAFV